MKALDRKHLGVLVLLISIQIIFAGISFFVPAANNWLTSADVGELIIGYVSLEATVISLSLALLHFSDSERQKRFEELFLKGIESVAHYRQMSAHEFYSSFASEITLCKRNANIAFFGAVPLSQSRAEMKRKTPADSVKIMKRRASEAIHYRRIVRLTEANLPWIEHLCEQLEGLSIYSMAVLKDNPGSVEQPLALSIQTFDGERCYLVDVGEYGPFSPKRDLMISSRPICKVFDNYYERLWQQSILLIQAGVLDHGSLKIVRSLASGQASA